jgi:Tfp pilus assembly protein PilX
MTTHPALNVIRSSGHRGLVPPDIIRPAPPRHAQEGAVLIVVLVLLLTAVIMSMGVMRASLSNDVITNNTRMQNLATEMAQLALRYCERDVLKAESGDATVALFGTVGSIQAAPQPGAQPSWKSSEKWKTSVVKTLRVTDLQSVSGSSGNSIVTLNADSPMPTCMAEHGPGSTMLVTSRGFSPDYAADNGGNTTRGSVVWLQSQFVVKSTP